MVEDLKSQMHRFRHLIGFKGYLDVTSAESMKRLIQALTSKYKKDIQKSLHLHRLQLYYDLKERHFKIQERREEKAISQDRANLRGRKEEKPEKDEDHKEVIETKSKKKEVSDEMVSVQATDIDDWKDLLTLAKIYYVLEHPRSEGLKWKRRTTKRKKVDQFKDMDLIEWRVAQNFRLRGLKEWAQCKSDADAYKLTEGSDLSYNSDEAEDKDIQASKMLDELLKVLDPYGKSNKIRARRSPKDKKPSIDRPFKFQDECVEDWTESYSEDSDYSHSDTDLSETIDDFLKESQEQISELDDRKRPSIDQQEDSTNIFVRGSSKFEEYKDSVFQEMDQAKTLNEWFGIYKQVSASLEKKPPPEYPEKTDAKLHVIAEDSEDEMEDTVSHEETAVQEKTEKKPPPEYPEKTDAKLHVIAEDSEDEKEDTVSHEETAVPEKTESPEKAEKEEGVDASIVRECIEQMKHSGKQEKAPKDAEHGEEETLKLDSESTEETPEESLSEEEVDYQTHTESEADEEKTPEKLESPSEEEEYQTHTESEADEEIKPEILESPLEEEEYQTNTESEADEEIIPEKLESLSEVEEVDYPTNTESEADEEYQTNTESETDEEKTPEKLKSPSEEEEYQTNTESEAD